VELDQVVAFLERVTDVDLDGFHHSGFGRGDFHAGLVRLQCDQTLFGFDGITHLDQDFNDLTFAADARYFDYFTHGIFPQQSSGLGLFGSRPKVACASTSTSGCSSPFSTSADSVE